MKLNGKPIEENSREYIALMKEIEGDTELALAIHPLQAVQSWPAQGESSFTEMDSLSRTQEIELPGIPFVHRSADTGEQAAVPQLMKRQALAEE